MKKLIAIATLGLALSFSSLGSGVAIQREGSQGTTSFASDYMDLYTKPLAKSEVKNEIRGGNVERDFTSFYTSPRSVSTPTLLTSDQRSDDEYISIFGVQIPHTHRV
jgi:hypothetical protein